MIARVKKSVNHSRIIQSMRETSISFLFRRHIMDFLVCGRIENVHRVATMLQLTVNLFPVICCLMEVNTFCGHARLKGKSCEELHQASSDYGFSCQHFTLENMGLNLACRCLLEITKTNRREYFTFPSCK